MFAKKSLFIIGAGASAEFGLPVGGELKVRIADALRFRFDFGSQLSGDGDLVGLLRHRYGQEVNSYTQAGNELSAIMQTFVSIDEALHYFSNRPEIVFLGKLSITQEILRAELNSILTDRNTAPLANVNAADETWMVSFFSMAVSSLRREDMKSAFENVTVINFNYDRVLEHYLYAALQVRAGLSSSEAIESLSKLKVIRPYGGIGKLNWQGADGIQFGMRPYQWETFDAVTSRLRTYTERYEDNLLSEIDVAISESRLVVFLGFGFHNQNLQLLRPIENSNRGLRRNVFATVSGINSANHEMLSSSLHDCFGERASVQLFSISCAEILQELRPSILVSAN